MKRLFRLLAKLGLIAAVLLATLCLAAVGVAAWQGSRTPTGNPEYVALGSSFAAGAGLGRLEEGSPLLCARSVNGYPQHLARMRGLSIVDMSCGGAVTKHLFAGGQFFQGPQVRTITSDTRLVTITAGGNDIGYVGDLSLLAMRRSGGLKGWLANTFLKGPQPLADRGFDQLGRDLDETIRMARIRSPEAVIVLATYPALLPPTGTCARIGLSGIEADTMREVGDQLAETTRAAARRNGVLLVDMHALGADHSACAAVPWTTGWIDAGPAPFHPTRAGAEATARAVAAALDTAR